MDHYNPSQQQYPTDSYSQNESYINTSELSLDDEGSSIQSKSHKLSPTEKSRIHQQNLVRKHGDDLSRELPALVIRFRNDWKKISKAINESLKIKTTPIFLKNFFKDQVQPQSPKEKKVLKFKFTHDFDLRLVALIDELGLEWVRIAEELEFSDPIKLKNRYYLHYKKKSLWDQLLAEVKMNQAKSKNVQNMEQQQQYLPVAVAQQCQYNANADYNFANGEPFSSDFDLFAGFEDVSVANNTNNCNNGFPVFELANEFF
eukprot:CAMPEP_0114592744 /NCGR_PEP_ID=MMETSP0125-20121206/14492_1 /TAXON_ID=485358 ORGANISM="Aristerostoma sp., Strain ATCC 50986" /NCGR_SAMPLE_ID=MMETSP0125 /ASSEMBLY_ACC=CAM_ASM_000245 /LENGTH=258 /DNA_ID=CAMNT_0001791537 /DNA_START=296 /DNA_END=1072 /DNA_ORIENTATION=+